MGEWYARLYRHLHNRGRHLLMAFTKPLDIEDRPYQSLPLGAYWNNGLSDIQISQRDQQIHLLIRIRTSVSFNTVGRAIAVLPEWAVPYVGDDNPNGRLTSGTVTWRDDKVTPTHNLYEYSQLQIGTDRALTIVNPTFGQSIPASYNLEFYWNYRKA